MTSRQYEGHGLPRISGLGLLAGLYDAVLCDIWGVVHNGVTAHAGAVDALTRFRSGGGRVVLISNAPRPAGEVEKMLAALDVPRAAWDAIVTSGDMTRLLLQARAGQAMYHLGPARDRAVFDGIAVRLTQPEDAAFVLCTGLFDDDKEEPESYRDALALLRQRGLDMICANPDLVVERGGRLVYCAGALAQLYETLGGRVIYAGKPHLPIYEHALEVLGADSRRVLAIGDSVRTDLAGAAGAGLDALFIIGGIHAGEDGGEEALVRMFQEAGVAPQAVLDRLRW